MTMPLPALLPSNTIQQDPRYPVIPPPPRHFCSSVVAVRPPWRYGPSMPQLSAPNHHPVRSGQPQARRKVAWPKMRHGKGSDGITSEGWNVPRQIQYSTTPSTLAPSSELIWRRDGYCLVHPPKPIHMSIWDGGKRC